MNDDGTATFVLAASLSLASCGGRSAIEAPASGASASTVATGSGGSAITSTGSGGATTSTGGAGGCGGGCVPPPMCESPLVPCNGACLDVSVDPANCGACGHDCLGGACEAGACLPVVLSDAAPAVDLALDAASLFWVTPEGNVWKVSIDGGSPVELFHHPSDNVSVNRDSAIAIHGGHVYWTSTVDANLRSIPSSGGDPVVLASKQWGQWTVAANHTGVYWGCAKSDPRIQRLPPGAASPTLVVKTDEPGKIAVDATHVYYGNDTGAQETSSLVKVPIGGGAPIELAKKVAVRRVIVDSTFAYWVDRGISNGEAGRVRRVPLGGGDVLVLTDEPVLPAGLATDGAHLYIADADTNNGRVLRVPIAGGEVVVLAENQNGPWSVAVDGEAVYWTTLDGVLKLAK